MSISTLPLSYCTNVHPGQTVWEIIHGLGNYTIPARQQINHKIAAGLWLPAAVVEQIHHDPAQLDALRETLQGGDLSCYTLNTFPYGNFHSERVKENVYLPDWTTGDRFDYTIACGKILAQLMPEGVEGSLSTVPLGFKGFDHDSAFVDQCISQLLKLAKQLDELHDETGRVIRLAIEPEPLCELETTQETIDFFHEMFSAAEQGGQLDIAQRHLGVCYDVCHQAVEFEDVESSIKALNTNEIRINKIHITCALRLESPAENERGRTELASFVEPRYLHQTFARTTDRTISQIDLTEEFCLHPPEEFQEADEWRIHFHVPVNQESVGELKTTRDDLKKALRKVAELEYAPHLEVETYTWNVLPGEQELSIVDGLVTELSVTQEILKNLSDE